MPRRSIAGRRVRCSVVVSRAAVLIALGDPAIAGADVSLKLEPGAEIPLTAPQSQIYDVGGGQSLKALFGLTPYLDVGPSVSVLVVPAAAEGAASGMAWGFGAGMRLKRPHDAVTFRGVSPWLEADALYVRTGGLDRPGFDLAVGLAVPVGDARRFWVGPFVRYMQTIQPQRDGYDNRDAKTLLVGISLEVGFGITRRPAVARLAELAPEPIAQPAAAAAAYADRDHDGIADTIDRCPDAAGPMENAGCPGYQKIVVKPDKLELKEKLYFAWDQAKLEDASLPVLDEVVLALKDNPGFRVQVEGHTDSSGADDHNQALSERRAAAVLDYLVSHGIATDRLVSKGFSSSMPIDTNLTVAGRENNRRVEFVVNFVLLEKVGAR